MFVLMISVSSLNMGNLGSKTRSPGQIKVNLVNTPEVTFFKIIVMNIAQNDDF